MKRGKPTVFVMEAQAKAALPLIQSLGRGGLRVAAGSDKRLACGFLSRHCHERVAYPPPRHDKAGFQEWLLQFLRGRPIEMLFPVGHYGAEAVSEIQDEVRRYTRLLSPDHATFLTAYAKVSTMKTALRAGVPIPDSWFPKEHPGGLEEVSGLIRSWPVLIKPSVGVGARGILWCYGADELRRRFAEAEAAYGECFVQDFVPPGAMQYKVDMLVDEKLIRLAGIVYGKTRMYPPDGGSSVLNFSADRPDVLDFAHRMLQALRWVGFCDFDFVVDPRDGVAKLMEINPRFPESVRMGTSVGIDFPMMMYRLAHGEAVAPVLDYPKNHFLRFLLGDVLWFLRVDNRSRFNTWPSWFHFSGHDVAYQLGSARDPGPAIGYIVDSLLASCDGALLRERLRLGSAQRKQRP